MSRLALSLKKLAGRFDGSDSVSQEHSRETNDPVPVSLAGILALGVYLALFTLGIVWTMWRVIPSCDVAGLVVTRLAPSQVLTSGGEQLRISGEGFQRGVTVQVGGAPPVEASVTNPLEIAITTPRQQTGRVGVAVAQRGFPPVEVPGGLEYVATRPTAPVVTGVLPPEARLTGGEQLRILGERFSPGARVQLGDSEPVQALFVSPSELRLTTTPRDAGVVGVTVLQESGSTTRQSSLQFVQTPSPAPTTPLQVSAIEPSSASVRGGDAVTITGSGFTADTRVRFGGLPARAVYVDGGRFITAVTPMHPAGAVSVLVANELSVSSLDGRFSFVCPAVPDATMVLLILLAGALGGLVHALRSFYWYVGERKLVWNWTTMYVLLPFTSSALGFVFYLVIRAGLYQPTGGTNYLLVGLSALVGMFSAQATQKLKDVAEGIFTKAHQGADAALPATVPAAVAPTVTTITPASGPPTGATTVRIGGTGFADQSAVRFGQTASPKVTFVNANTLQAVTPARPSPGAVDVGVAVPGKAEVVKAGGYTYAVPKGKVDSVEPAEGITAGGTTVKLKGEQFTNHMSVLFGEEPAKGVKFIDATEAEVITPRQRQPGAVDVRVDAGPDLIGIAPGAFTYKP